MLRCETISHLYGAVVVSRTHLTAEQSLTVILPSQDGGVRQPRPKGFGAVGRSRWSPRFSSSAVQVGEVSECEVLGQISLIAVNVLSSRVSRASKEELACSWASYRERSKLTEVKSV